MQRLDSSCQEADFIINSTLLKLKGSTNNNSNLRQAAQLQTASHQQQSQQQQQQIQSQTQQHQRQQQYQSQLHPNFPTLQHQQQSTSQPTHHNLVHHTASSTIPYLNQIQPHPPPYIFDQVESITNYTTVPGTISDHDFLASVGVATDTHQQMSVLNDNLLSNINSIISPPSVVPDMILSTSPTSPVLNCSKSEKRTLNSDISNNMYNSSPPIKKAKLTTNLSSFNSSSALQSLAPAESLPTYKTATSTITSQIQQNPNISSDVDPYKQLTNIGQSAPALNANVKTVTYTPQTVPVTPTSHINVLPPTTPGNPPHATASVNSTFFNIHDKIRELYLYLLINDEKTFKESRRRHRTRSFVLERLVEREKLNTIVVNLYPGNKGYSLALYQDDKNDDNTVNDSQNLNASNLEGISSQNDRGSGPCEGDGGGGNSSILLNQNSSIYKVETNASSSRLKQTQISSNNLSSSNTNNLLISNNLDADDMDTDDGDTCISTAADTLNESVDNINATASSTIASVNDNILNASNAAVADEDINEDANLVEIQRWPYEVDALLNSIDKEELPILFSNILESGKPNVFYSGCVICQIRDFRQTFPISSNSCDIYHVLLKPTNDTIYSDINKLSIKTDINAEDKLLLESQLLLATSEPLCLDPDPKIGRFAINNQHIRQIWNTSTLRRQMKKYSQISINRKRKIDQFTYHNDRELFDHLERIRQRPRINMLSSNSTTPFLSGVSTNSSTVVASFAANKLPKKRSEIVKLTRPPELDYPLLSIPQEINVEKYAKKYDEPKETQDCLPQLIEEHILETDREARRVYHIKLSIFQRPANSEYLGELYVDRDYRNGERNGEACQFSLGTRFHANRYIEQFKEIFTEEGRKSVKITHKIPGQPAKVTYTPGMPEHKKHQQKQAALAAAAAAAAALQQQQQQQQQQVQQHSTQTLLTAGRQSQQQQIHIAPALNATNPNTLPGNQLNMNLQGANIVGITTTGNVQQLRHQAQQIFDAPGAFNVQGQQTQQISLTNGSLLFVQQQAPGTAVQANLAVQNSSNHQKAQMLTNSGQLTAANALRNQLGSNVPILQAQLKAAPLVSGQQQQILQKTPAAIHSINPTINALVTGFMNSSNQFQQQQQQQQHQVALQSQAVQKSSSSEAILSLLNSTPAAMTNSPVVRNTFNPSTAQQQQTLLQQQHQQLQQTHQAIPGDAIIQQQPQQRKNEVMQNLLSNNLRKINMVSGNGSGSATLAVAGNGRSSANLIAVSAMGLGDNATAQNVRVTMSALASQLASPPAVMTNTGFGYAAVNNNNNSITLNNNNNIKIVNSRGQRVITATVAAPSPGSDSNASSTDLSQTPHGTPGSVTSMGSVTSTLSNHALLERLNSGTNLSTSPGLSPQPPQTNVVKNIVQHAANVHSPSASISPLSSPPPLPSPQSVQQPAQTTILNLPGLNLQLQGAIATFSGLQNAQVQIPGLTSPISLPIPNSGLATAVQQQQPSSTSAGQQGNAQQTTSLLVSVPATSTTQVNTIQTVPGAGNCGTVVSVPATAAGTQTVVLTNAAVGGNPSSSVTGSMLSLPIAQFVTSNVKGLNTKALRTAAAVSSNSQNVVNSNIIPAAGGGANVGTIATGTNTLAGQVNVSNASANQSIQLLNAIQQRSCSIQVVGPKQLTGRGPLGAQRTLSASSLKIAAPISGSPQINAPANVSATQKLQLKLQKQSAQQQQQLQQQQNMLQSQSSQHIQMTGAQQRLMTAAAIAVANQSQKRRRSATDVNK